MRFKSKQDQYEAEANEGGASRREFLKMGAGTGAAAAGIAMGALAPVTAVADDFKPNDPDASVDADLGADTRALAAFNLKNQAALQHLDDTLALGKQRDNRDEKRYRKDRFYASFTKTLPSNQYGEVNPAAFKALRTAMRSGAQADFDAIALNPGAARPLANPQGAFRYVVCGLDSHASRMPPSLKFRSAKLAAEVGEVYWQALTRDVPS